MTIEPGRERGADEGCDPPVAPEGRHAPFVDPAGEVVGVPIAASDARRWLSPLATAFLVTIAAASNRLQPGELLLRDAVLRSEPRRAGHFAVAPAGGARRGLGRPGPVASAGPRPSRGRGVRSRQLRPRSRRCGQGLPGDEGAGGTIPDRSPGRGSETPSSRDSRPGGGGDPSGIQGRRCRSDAGCNQSFRSEYGGVSPILLDRRSLS
jgi:hypothetical protein